MALPGVNTIINDRFFTLSRTNIPLITRIAIIGRRNPSTDDTTTKYDEVNDLEPYNASNERTVIERFGAMSDLHRGYLEAVASGATRVTLIPLPADTVFDYDTGSITSADWESTGADPDYVSDDPGNGLFHAVFSEAESIGADIIVPWGAGGDPTYGGSATPSTPFDDVSDADYFGFYADNNAVSGTSFANKVANKCAQITADSHPCFAVMGVRPYDEPSNPDGSIMTSALTQHLTLPNLMDREDMDNGIYLSVVATEFRPRGYNKTYSMGFANGAASYAGTLAQLDAWSAPTGKVVYNIESVRYNPTRTQQNAMIEKGIVPVALNFSRVPTWVDGQTFSKVGSDYARLSTLRIVFDAVKMVRQTTQRFIGEGTTIETRNAIDTAVSSGLRSMLQLGAILNGDHSITYVPSESKAIVNLVLQPAFELRNIEVSISVQLS